MAVADVGAGLFVWASFHEYRLYDPENNGTMLPGAISTLLPGTFFPLAGRQSRFFLVVRTLFSLSHHPLSVRERDSELGMGHTAGEWQREPIGRWMVGKKKECVPQGKIAIAVLPMGKRYLGVMY